MNSKTNNKLLKDFNPKTREECTCVSEEVYYGFEHEANSVIDILDNTPLPFLETQIKNMLEDGIDENEIIFSLKTISNKYK